MYKTQKKGDNSGVFIRIPEKPTEPWIPVNRGYEVQTDDSQHDYHITDVLSSWTKAMAKPGKTRMEHDGHHARWPAHDRRLKGVKVTDFTEGRAAPPKVKSYEPDRGPRPESGSIGLQNHSGSDTVFFRGFAVRPLH